MRMRAVPAMTATLAALAAVASTPAIGAPPNLALEFESPVAGTLGDRDGEGTGFTGVQENKLGINPSNALPFAYMPQLLDVAQGRLAVNTTLGDMKVNNLQDNALQVTFDGSQPHQVSASLKGPFSNLVQPFQGGGIFVGPSQDQFVKLVVNVDPNGNARTELYAETPNATLPGGVQKQQAQVLEESIRTADVITLSLGVDSASGRVDGAYAIDGGPSKAIGPVAIPGLSGNSATAGILTTNYNDPAPAPSVQMSFEQFAVRGASTLPPEESIDQAPGSSGSGTTVTSTGELCSTVPERTASGPSGTFTLSRAQLIINQRISQAAVRRLNAVTAWLDGGIRREDICGGAMTSASFASDVTTAPTSVPHPLSPPSPRPLDVKKSDGGNPSDVALSSEQLLINQRISQAAVRRANAVNERLQRGLTGGDLVGSAIDLSKVAQGTSVTGLSPGTPAPPPSKTILGSRKSSDPGAVELSVSQLKINQRVAQAAVKRANALSDGLRGGLRGRDFADGSITSASIGIDIGGS